MKKYIVKMTKGFYVMAEDEADAEDKAVEICAKDSEALIPHNMDVQVESGDELPDNCFI